MDKLIEFLMTKVGYVLTVILGFIAPGNILIFVWNRILYLEMDVIKLLILSFSISFIIFIPNIVISFIVYFIHERDKALDNKEEAKFDLLYYTLVAIVLTVIEILGAIFLISSKGNSQLNVYIEWMGTALAIAAAIMLIVLAKKRFIKKKE